MYICVWSYGRVWVCVSVGGCVGGWVGGWVRACVHVYVCHSIYVTKREGGRKESHECERVCVSLSAEIKEGESVCTYVGV